MKVKRICAQSGAGDMVLLRWGKASMSGHGKREIMFLDGPGSLHTHSPKEKNETGD